MAEWAQAEGGKLDQPDTAAAPLSVHPDKAAEGQLGTGGTHQPAEDKHRERPGAGSDKQHRGKEEEH